MIEFCRSMVRPIVTFIFAAVIAQVIVEQIPIPEYQWLVLVIPIGWWFRDRTIAHNKKKPEKEK